jgi:hypothetical protein
MWRLRPSTLGGMHLFFKVYDGKDQVVREGRAGLLDKTVGPGEAVDLALVVPPLPAGRYRLFVDMVDEGHAWFYQAGADPWEEELIVRE